MDINSDVSTIKGVGPKALETLKKCMIFNIMDLLLYIPRDYEYISACNNIKGINSNDKIILKCVAERILKDIRTKTGKILSTVTFRDGDNIFSVKWFNQPYVKNNFNIGEEYILMGKVENYRGVNTMLNPIIIKNNDLVKEEYREEKIIPKYPLRGDITNNFIIKLIKEVLPQIKISENLPNWIIHKYKLPSLDNSIRAIHSPKNKEELLEAQKRLKYQELFSYSLKILMLKEYLNEKSEGIAFSMCKELSLLKEMLPFKLTSAQSRVVREILLDQKKSSPANRLVQGDVGSGKTIVAIIALFNVVMNGYQGVLMAPTEILAIQHYNEICKLLKGFNLNISLLTGSTTQKNKNIIKENLKNGEIQLIIGTHALIQEDVEFNNLGMVVTDEQHRFGVMQRSKLYNKGKNIDVLVMTATPIPRTLALYLYSDLNVSIIDELPPGRKLIETTYKKKEDKDKVYEFSINELEKGRQVYIVCPLVEENEELDLTSVQELFEELKNNWYKNYKVEMLHGKMSPKIKSDIMNRFKSGEINIIVSTTVIEVGINVPNATLMIIENAERFGLAQLHQLRGRVGRGEHKSYCMLIAEVKNDIIRRRMEIISGSNDGFFIAEEDLKIRGTGELFGFRQHGEDGLLISNVVEDINILKNANIDAKKMISSEDEIDTKIKNEIYQKLLHSSNFICFN